MKGIIQLTILEYEKIWCNKIRKVSIIIIIAYCLLFMLLNNGIKDLTKSSEDNSITWQEKMKNDTVMLDTFANQNDEYTAILGSESIVAQKAINEYRLRNNLEPIETFWETSIRIINSSFKVLLIFICIISINTITSEYQKGTIKQLFIRPYSRFKILLSKIFGISLFSILLLLIIFLVSIILSRIYNPVGNSNHLFIGFFSDKIFIIKYYKYEILAFILYILIILLAVSFCFTMSLIIKSKSITIVIALISLLFGSSISRAMIGKLSFIKFTFLNNLNLLEYFNFGRNNGITFFQSIIIIFINIILLNILSIYIFRKREIYS